MIGLMGTSALLTSLTAQFNAFRLIGDNLTELLSLLHHSLLTTKHSIFRCSLKIRNCQPAPNANPVRSAMEQSEHATDQTQPGRQKMVPTTVQHHARQSKQSHSGQLS